jgi:hypothetical protein
MESLRAIMSVKKYQDNFDKEAKYEQVRLSDDQKNEELYICDRCRSSASSITRWSIVLKLTVGLVIVFGTALIALKLEAKHTAGVHLIDQCEPTFRVALDGQDTNQNSSHCFNGFPRRQTICCVRSF